MRNVQKVRAASVVGRITRAQMSLAGLSDIAQNTASARTSPCGTHPQLSRTDMPQINPDILLWARETAGLSIEEAASALQLGGVRQPGAVILRAYESGEHAPSRPLLLKMVKVYRRPLLVFYLAEPPRRADRGEDFRTLPPDQRVESAVALDALVRDVHVRQRLVRTTLEEAEEAVAHSFVGSVTLDQPVADVVTRVARTLQFDRAAFRRTRTVEDAFAYLRDQVERTGVFVLLMGNLGSHHSNISPEVFRGFAIADDVAPFIAVNDQDAKSAWSFTLLHELIHIWLGQSGVSGGAPEQRVEKFCNDVASRLLLQDAELDDLPLGGMDLAGMAQRIGEFADARKISRPLVGYRLLQRGHISHPTWQQLSRIFRDSWLKERDAKAKRVGAPSYYTVRRHRLGGALLDLVKRTVDEGILTPTKAGRVLGVKPTNVATLLGGA